MGVPLMVTVLLEKLPVTPGGRPVKIASVAPVVLYVILPIEAVKHKICASVPVAEVRDIVGQGTKTVKVLSKGVPVLGSSLTKLVKLLPMMVHCAAI